MPDQQHQPTLRDLLDAVHQNLTAVENSDRKNVDLTSAIKTEVAELRTAIHGTIQKPADGMAYRLAKLEERHAAAARLIWIIVGVLIAGGGAWIFKGHS